MNIGYFSMFCIIAFNTGWIYVQYKLQYCDLYWGEIARQGTTIPNTDPPRKFLYMQDFATNLWGDLIALPLLQIGFADTYSRNLFGTTEEIIFSCTIPLSILAFRSFCLRPNHIPDSGFPKSGVTSYSGWWHLPYLGINSAIAAVDCWILATNPEAPRTVLLTGGAFYTLTFVIDCRRGNFDSLQPQEQGGTDESS